MRLIDADELKKVMCADCDNKHLCTETPACDTVREIDAQPTIEPIKHGKWEMYGAVTRGTLAVPIYRCSECKEDTNNWFWHYCPNCGCRMDGKDEMGE